MGVKWFNGSEAVPAFELLKLYNKFGFRFGHIYAFEITFSEPRKVFDLVSKELMPSYHWINAGVSTNTSSTLHPFASIISRFTEDDLVVVKFDVDTPSVEILLVDQLLHNKEWAKLIDQFYFEQHVFMEEMATSWNETMKGSMGDSFRLFYNLRQQGIPAHFWV